MDDGVEMVCEMVEEITENAYKIVYDHYLTEHAFPYAINDAKETILRIITVRESVNECSYYGTSDKGHSELRTTSIQRTLVLSPTILQWDLSILDHLGTKVS